METNPATAKSPLTILTHNLPRYNEYFVLSLAVSKNDMMIQIVDKPNTTPISQDSETLTFKALLCLNVAVHAQVCKLFCVVYFPLFSLVQHGYPAITNIFVVNQIFRYNGVFARYNEHFFGTVTLSLRSKRFRRVWEQRKTEERGFRYFACAENGTRAKKRTVGVGEGKEGTPELLRNACYAGYVTLRYSWVPL